GCTQIPVCYSAYLHRHATPYDYSLSLPDALPISCGAYRPAADSSKGEAPAPTSLEESELREDSAVGRDELRRREGSHPVQGREADRKSTRLNSSHVKTSYAVFSFI